MAQKKKKRKKKKSKSRNERVLPIRPHIYIYVGRVFWSRDRNKCKQQYWSLSLSALYLAHVSLRPLYCDSCEIAQTMHGAYNVEFIEWVWSRWPAVNKEQRFEWESLNSYSRWHLSIYYWSWSTIYVGWSCGFYFKLGKIMRIHRNRYIMVDFPNKSSYWPLCLTPFLHHNICVCKPATCLDVWKWVD